jgi:hypothetical protein
MAFFAIIVIACFAIAEGSAILWRPLAVVCYVLLLAGITPLLYAAFYSVAIRNAKYTDVTLAVSLAVLFTLVVGFSQLCRHLAYYFGGFSPATDNYWDWTRYGALWVLDNTLFNLSQIFQWQVSDIQAVSLWSRLLVWVFNIVLEVFAIVTFLRAINLVRTNWDGIGASSTRGFMDFLLSGFGRLLVAALWFVPLLLFIGATIERGLSLISIWSASRYIAPVVVGLWLVWHCAVGVLRLRGFTNKVLALTGLGLGIAILYFTLPPALGYLDF